VEKVGPFDSDIDPTVGVEHAEAIASAIASSSSSKEDGPLLIYASPFLRTTHTACIISRRIPSSTVRIEEGLYEWMTPSLLVEPNGIRTQPRSLDQLVQHFPHASIDPTYQSVNPVMEEIEEENNDKSMFSVPTLVPEGAPHFEETEEALLKRCATTLERLLAQVGDRDISLVSHAPCDQAFALYLEGKGVTNTELKAWPLGGITCFSRTITVGETTTAWTIDQYGDTTHMPGPYRAGLKEWSLPCIDAANDTSAFTN
jgi:broad specificity phosphatase PhoE